MTLQIDDTKSIRSLSTPSLSLCADVPPPAEKKIDFFFTEGGERGGVCTQATPSQLINFQWDGHFLNWQLGDVSQRCPSQRQLKYIIKFLMCFTQGWTHMG